MTDVTNESVFSTCDITLAATLITIKFRMDGIDYLVEGSKRDPKGYFKFEDTPSLKEARQKFMQGLLQVEPKLFMTNLHSLKAEVQNWVKNPHNRSF